MPNKFTLRNATANDAEEIADLHLNARREAMPYLAELHTPEETRAWFRRRIVGDHPGAWWVAESISCIVGYIVIHGNDQDDLYVRIGWQRRGVGSLLLKHAKELNPQKLQLYAFQRNTSAQAFYEAHGFRAVTRRDGSHNEEGEPDIEYEWQGAAQ